LYRSFEDEEDETKKKQMLEKNHLLRTYNDADEHQKVWRLGLSFGFGLVFGLAHRRHSLDKQSCYFVGA
jgi:hypothetical protein